MSEKFFALCAFLFFALGIASLFTEAGREFYCWSKMGMDPFLCR